MIDRVDRERQVIDLLDELPESEKFVLIGGYAVAAYGPARYSDDIDFVVTAESLLKLLDWFEERGFARKLKGTKLASQTFKNATRLERDSVRLDLLDEYVQDRDARVRVPEPWIAMDPRRVRLDLLSGRTNRRVPVARPEALWALKLQSGRDQDIIDLFAIRREPVVAAEVSDLFADLMAPTLVAKLQQVLLKTESPKLYTDARSRLALKDSPTARLEWTKFRELVRRMIPHSA